LVDGDIGESATAQRIVDVATDKFKSIDALVNNAGERTGQEPYR
jgi:NADP-dependent 3-hydroxy acid dehydrogenase YdfG